MQIVLLDRNVVSVCRQKLNGQAITAYRKRELRKLNSPKNKISPLFAIIEGSKGIDETYAEKLQTLENEVKVIKRYFKKAYTDSEFLLENKELTAKLFSEHYVEENAKNYLKFITEMHPLLFQPIAENKTTNIKNKILCIAKQSNVELTHLVVISALGVLYGNKKLRKIFKFTNNHDITEIQRRSYNAYNDLIIVSRIFRLVHRLKETNIKEKIIYFTFDKSLKSFINSAILEESKAEYNDASISFNMKITFTDLFPSLSEQEIDALKNELSNQ